MARGRWLSGGAGALLLLGLLLWSSSKGGGAPATFPAKPAGAFPTGHDWYAVHDGNTGNWSETLAQTLAQATAQHRSMREAAKLAGRDPEQVQLFRWSDPFQKWLKVA